MDITTFKEKFDAVLEERLDTYIKDLKRFTRDTFILDVSQYPRDLMTGGGKRIRPYLAYLMYKAAGGRKDQAFLKFIAGLEVFHLFSIVHDDIIARSYERRGKLAVHKYIITKLKKDSRKGDHGHTANGIAMLVGDLLFTWSTNILTDIGEIEPKAINCVREVYRDMSVAGILGQMIEVDTTTRRSVDEKAVLERIRLKTAEYSFVAPLLMGQALGGSAKGISQNFCREFGLALGMAFQIQDDYLELSSSSKELGRPILNDISDNVHTIFTCHVFKNGSPKDKAELDGFMGYSISEADAPAIRDLFERTDSFEYGKKVMKKYFKKARGILKNSKMQVEHKKQFEDFLDWVEVRNQ
jgi:geranylgeranyl diphosphate synthase type I